MSEKREKETKQTELEKRDAGGPSVRTPFAFVPPFRGRHGADVEDFEDFRLPGLLGKEFFPFRTEMKDVA